MFAFFHLRALGVCTACLLTRFYSGIRICAFVRNCLGLSVCADVGVRLSQLMCLRAVYVHTQGIWAVPLKLDFSYAYSSCKLF